MVRQFTRRSVTGGCPEYASPSQALHSGSRLTRVQVYYTVYVKDVFALLAADEIILLIVSRATKPARVVSPMCCGPLLCLLAFCVVHLNKNDVISHHGNTITDVRVFSRTKLRPNARSCGLTHSTEWPIFFWKGSGRGVLRPERPLCFLPRRQATRRFLLSLSPVFLRECSAALLCARAWPQYRTCQ